MYWESSLFQFCAAAAAAESLQSYPTLCDSVDGSAPGFSVPGILQARMMKYTAISFFSAYSVINFIFLLLLKTRVDSFYNFKVCLLIASNLCTCTCKITNEILWPFQGKFWLNTVNVYMYIYIFMCVSICVCIICM